MIISDREWKYALECAEKASDNFKLGMLGMTFNKKEIMSEVKKHTEFGEAYVTMQLNFRDKMSVDLMWINKQINILKTVKDNYIPKDDDLVHKSKHDGYLQALHDMQQFVDIKFDKNLK